jgi:hypothetical protein
MPLYQLKRPYWDGQNLYPIDTELMLAEGTQPPSAVLLETAVKPKVAAKSAATLTELDELDDSVDLDADADTLSGLSKGGKK